MIAGNNKGLKPRIKDLMLTVSVCLQRTRCRTYGQAGSANAVWMSWSVTKYRPLSPWRAGYLMGVGTNKLISNCPLYNSVLCCER